MLFNSIDFLFFLPLVFLLYWFVFQRKLTYQNILLLVASYFFYSCWDWRFLFLLIFSTLLDYFSGIKIFNSNSLIERKIWLWISITINLGFLAVFKYFNFFIDSFVSLFAQLGFVIDVWALNVILPVGISFYTFHGLSYVIDVYKKRIDVERNFIDYSLFVSFFPLLVAGPIERATHLLPQIKSDRRFDYQLSVDGLRQILWGFFKKIVIADQCAIYANQIFDNSADYTGSTLVLGAIFFAFQIYGDFSGYSDIALGTAKLFGIRLLKNFSFPYFSKDIAEFWRRWHISLSTWFKDYLYIPLGGSRGNLSLKIRNTFIIFIVSGFWHGANWTFIAWGFLNALFIIPSIIFNSNRNNLNIVALDRTFPTLREVAMIFVTFSLTTFAWIFFRSPDIKFAFNYVSNIFDVNLFSLPEIHPLITIALVLFFILIEWFGRRGEFALSDLFIDKPSWIRLSFYYLILISIVVALIYSEGQDQFIYFQF
ncbi:MAG: MBOAT family protein [Bacteroidia bacterium]|nr:MBOAT family protein [Bacteroidia bacterium]